MSGAKAKAKASKAMTKKEMLSEAKQALRMASWYRSQLEQSNAKYAVYVEAQHAALVLEAKELIATVRRKVWAEKLARKVGAFPKAVGYHSLLLTMDNNPVNTNANNINNAT